MGPESNSAIMIRMFNFVEETIFKLSMAVAMPILIAWTTWGLRREDLTEELKEFWQELKD